ncbi:hypothetical protein MKD38_18755 [Cupriavidus sp. WGlv3]|uniref:hypothetical protein n=1 Tax=Cupriavidus sp. WGlv3 TaxID=2919924 RepID=UPI00209112F0|nr:hypothetical protein [Cupriavidus sp. WGlv3]MCO4863723.1 hypothetical protein [Cupriavidus sp. WGlv3]
MNAKLVTKVLAKIGYVLLNVQSTERVIKRVMQIAVPRESDLFISLTERLASKDMDRPLGAFLTELRKRANLHGQVDELLRRFLLRRNVFIHDISKPDGWTLKTGEGLLVIDRQLNELLADSEEIRTLFMGLLYSWKVQGEMEPAKEEEEAFQAISGKYEGGVLSRKWGSEG